MGLWVWDPGTGPLENSQMSPRRAKAERHCLPHQEPPATVLGPAWDTAAADSAESQRPPGRAGGWGSGRADELS